MSTRQARDAAASRAGPPLSALQKLALILAGYFVAVAAAAMATVTLLLAPAVLSYGSFEAALSDVPAMLALGFIWTFICALPGFIVAIVLGERQAWRGWSVYALAGLLNVIPSFAVLGVLAGSPQGIPDLLFAAFPGGVAGGAAYWAGAGRFVAAYR